MLQPKKSILDKSKLKTEKNFITNSNLSNDQKEKINNELLFNSNWYSNRKQVFDNTGKSQSINANSFIPSTSPKIELNNVYGELGSYTPKEDLIELNKKFQNRQRGTVVHEDDHRRLRYSSMDDKINLISTPLRNSMTSEHANTFSTRNEKSQDVQYEYNPSEIHANIQNLRFYNNLKPDQYIDEETMKNIKIQEKQYLLEKFNSEEIRGMLNSTVYNDNSKNNIHFAAQGGYINQNTNMNRYAQGGDLTQFNEGGLHSQNPLGGVPIGNNNSVEQGETKQNNFVYSNRIFLDSNIVSQYNLPKSLIGKSVADATKYIDDKFKGRNDKISQSTKNGMLSKIAEAQEAMKPQEPETEQPQEGVEQSQMAYGGNINRYENGQQLGDTFVNTAATGADMIIPGSGQLLKMGDQLGQSIGNSIGGNRGESIGGLISPMGTLRGLGSALKTGNINDIPGIGIFGGKTSKQKLDIENANNLTLASNKKFSDQYSLGGILNPTKITKQQLQNTTVLPNTNPTTQSDRFRYAVGEQGGVQHGTSGEPGHYLYYGKKPGDAGFNPAIHREFVNQGGYDTYMRSPQGQQYRRNLSTQSLQPIEQLGYGGKVRKMEDGGYYDKNRPYFTTNPGTVVPTNQETVSSNKLVPFPRPQLQGLSFIPPINKEERVAYQRSKGLSAKDATGTLGPKTKAWIASDVMNSIPETPPSVNTGDPIITPTQTQAGFEAYYNNTKQNQITAKPSFGQQVWDGTKATGKFVNKNAGNIARYAPIAANALQLAMLKKPQSERLDRLGNRYKPEYVDEAQLQNIANQTMNNTVNAVSQSGASQGQLRSSIVGSQLQRTKAISDAYSQAAAQNRQQNAMAQEFNLGVDQTNLGQSTLEKDINARDQAAYRNAKREYITGIGEGIGDIGKEQTYKKIIAKTTGYKWDGEYVKSPDGTVVTDPLTGKPMTEEKLKELQSTKDKKALGGYLIKNKVK